MINRYHSLLEEILLRDEYYITNGTIPFNERSPPLVPWRDLEDSVPKSSSSFTSDSEHDSLFSCKKLLI